MNTDPYTINTDATLSSRPARMMSVDALRGFDMFWIIGGEGVAKALDGLDGGPVMNFIATQLKHVDWDGFHFFDGIFPLFLFLVGVAIVFSLDRVRREGGVKSALARIVRRSALLFIVGVFYYGGVAREWPDVQLFGVLQRIALCYLAAATLYLFLPRKGIIVTAIACLVGYWAMLALVPFPDVDLKQPTLGKNGTQASAKSTEQLFSNATMTRGIIDEGHNLTHYVDARWMPGKKRNLYYTNEGLLSTIPAVATTLFGIMGGWVLTAAGWSERKKVALLIGGGALGIALGCLLGLEFPIIKRLWTSSFCLVASGFSAMLVGIFYLVVDVWRWQRWCVPFLWIGANALAVYLAVNIVDFGALAERFVGGDVKRFLDAHLTAGTGGLLIALVALLLPVLLVRFLYQRKIFIRL